MKTFVGEGVVTLTLSDEAYNDSNQGILRDLGCELKDISFDCAAAYVGATIIASQIRQVRRGGYQLTLLATIRKRSEVQQIKSQNRLPELQVTIRKQ